MGICIRVRRLRTSRQQAFWSCTALLLVVAWLSLVAFQPFRSLRRLAAVDQAQNADLGLAGPNPAVTEKKKISQPNGNSHIRNDVHPSEEKESTTWRAGGGTLATQRHVLASSTTTYVAPTTRQSRMPTCKYPSPHLQGEKRPHYSKEPPPEGLLIQTLRDLLPGGCWKPQHCSAVNGSIAILIPAHNRRSQLLQLLSYLIPLLQRQQQDFCIFVGNQSESSAMKRFNKGAVVDALFEEAMKRRNWTCVCIHDVDVIPENDHNAYSCPGTRVRNLMSGLSKWSYGLAYPFVFGGCTVTMSEHFRRHNGLTSILWGWGSEDDDHRRRLGWAGLEWERSGKLIGNYFHANHEPAVTNPARFGLVPHAEEYWQKYGLSSLHYSVSRSEVKHLYSAFEFQLPQQDLPQQDLPRPRRQRKQTL